MNSQLGKSGTEGKTEGQGQIWSCVPQLKILIKVEMFTALIKERQADFSKYIRHIAISVLLILKIKLNICNCTVQCSVSDYCDNGITVRLCLILSPR